MVSHVIEFWDVSQAWLGVGEGHFGLEHIKHEQGHTLSSCRVFLSSSLYKMHISTHKCFLCTHYSLDANSMSVIGVCGSRSHILWRKTSESLCAYVCVRACDSAYIRLSRCAPDLHTLVDLSALHKPIKVLPDRTDGRDESTRHVASCWTKGSCSNLFSY